MKKIKKVLFAVCLICSVMVIAALCCGFTKTTAYAAENETETVVSEIETTQETPVETETFLSRIEQWFNSNFLKFMSTTSFGSTVAMLITIILDKRSSKKTNKNTQEIILSNNDSNGKVVDTVNDMISEYSEVFQLLHYLKENGAEIVSMTKEMLAYGKSVMEILVAVYANNKNIPQATKDLVQLKYVAALKAKNELDTILETTAVEADEEPTNTSQEV